MSEHTLANSCPEYDEIKVDGAPEKDGTIDENPVWFRAINKPTVKNAITAVISLLLILLAFCPFISVSTMHGKYSSYETSFSPMEITHYTIKSFEFYNSARIKYKPEYQDYMKAESKISFIKETQSLSPMQKEHFADYAKSAIAVNVMRVDAYPKLTMVVASLLTILYLSVASISLIASVFALILGLISKDKMKSSRLSARLLGIIASGIPIYMIILAHASRFSNSLAVSGFGNAGVSLAWGFVLTIILASLVPIYVALSCFAKITGFCGFPASHGDKQKIVAVFLLLAAVFSVFLPSISVSCATPLGKKSSVKGTAYVSVFDVYEFSESDSDYYSDSGLSSNEELIDAAKEVTESASTGNVGADILNGVLFYNGDFSLLYAFSTLFTLVFMLLAIKLIRRLVDSLLYGKEVRKRKKKLGFTLAFSIFHLAMYIAISIVANLMLHEKITHYILFGVGFGPILAVILTISACITFRIRHNEKAINDFDNPDISSAPYVLNN